MKNFRNYVGKKIKTKSGKVVRIKKLLNIEGPLNYDLCPSYWLYIVTYETDQGKVFLYYFPYYFEKKEWITEEEEKEEEEFKKWLYRTK
jgi:hypothetical protein